MIGVHMQGNFDLESTSHLAANQPEENERQQVYYRCKQKDKELYKHMNKNWEKLTCYERLCECMHLFDCQINEALNTSVGKYTRNGRMYSRTMSLTNCVMMAIGFHNLGYYGYWSQDFLLLSQDISLSLMRHLQNKDKKKETEGKYELTPEQKRKKDESNS